MTPRPLPSWQRSGARSEGEKDETPSLLAPLGFPTDHLGEWKHAVVQGKGSMNVAVASDFDKDGHIDAMTSFGYGVTVFKGPDWKSSRQVVRFKEAYEGKGKSEAVAYMAACSTPTGMATRTSWAPTKWSFGWNARTNRSSRIGPSGSSTTRS